MGRKKLDFNCKYCGQCTEVMHKPVYVDSYKGYFCDLDCYQLQGKNDEKEKQDEVRV